MSQGHHIAGTMPEAKFRSIKKQVRPARPAVAVAHPAGSPAAVANAALPAVTSTAFTAAAVMPVKKEKITSKAKKSFFTPISFWPVFVGLFLSGYVSQWQSMASQLGVWGMRLAFPLTLLATHREIGIDSQMAAILPQIALYAQLPLEGLLMKITLDRGKGLLAAVVQLALVHLVATLVLWLISFSHS